MYNTKFDWAREGKETSRQGDTRKVFRKDYARLIHSTSFRRLTGKTQLFPGPESDYFRNRLTHSLEVAQIAKSIAMRLNEGALKNYPLDLDLMEFSALAHDLGHPPFGHIGEKALDNCMKKYGGFEGNAQTLRILSKIEKKIKDSKSNDVGFYKGKDLRHGLNLTYRSLASILKYDNEIPFSRKDNDELAKGYYRDEKELVNKIKEKIYNGYISKGEFKTIECQIMDIADDIAYSTFDLEDAFKANFITPLDFLAVNPTLEQKIFTKIEKKGELPSFELENVLQILSAIITKGITPQRNQNSIYASLGASFSLSKTLADNGYYRYQFSSALINEFITGIELKKINKKCPALSEINVRTEVKAKIEVLKYFIFYSITMSPRLKMPEYRGYEIVETIFKILSKDEGFQLLPNDYRQIYDQIDSEEHRMRTICDFIAGMTDRYVIEFYGRLKSENPQTIFKPY